MFCPILGQKGPMDQRLCISWRRLNWLLPLHVQKLTGCNVFITYSVHTLCYIWHSESPNWGLESTRLLPFYKSSLPGEFSFDQVRDYLQAKAQEHQGEIYNRTVFVKSFLQGTQGGLIQHQNRKCLETKYWYILQSLVISSIHHLL